MFSECKYVANLCATGSVIEDSAGANIETIFDEETGKTYFSAQWTFLPPTQFRSKSSTACRLN